MGPTLIPTFDAMPDPTMNIMISTKILNVNNLFVIDKNEDDNEDYNSLLIGIAGLVGICMLLNMPFIILCIWNCCIERNRICCREQWYVRRRRTSTFQRINTPELDITVSIELDDCTPHTDIDSDVDDVFGDHSMFNSGDI